MHSLVILHTHQLTREEDSAVISSSWQTSQNASTACNQKFEISINLRTVYLMRSNYTVRALSYASTSVVQLHTSTQPAARNA